MRIVNVGRRLVLLDASGAGLDVEKASHGKFASDPQALFDQWDTLRTWADRLPSDGAFPVDDAELGAPAPAPRQVFAIGLNYAEHAAESNMGRPDTPPVFTKFRNIDHRAYRDGHVAQQHRGLGGRTGGRYRPAGGPLSEAAAWGHVAGFMVGQDLSERVVQLAGPAPQFSLGKSYPGFAPLGPRWSPWTSSATRTISSSAAPWTTKSCSKDVPAT